MSKIKYYKISKKHELFDGVIGSDIRLKLSQRVKILFSKGIQVSFIGIGPTSKINELKEENRKLKIALDNAIKECCINVNGSDACNSLDELYKSFEKKVWKNVY